MTRIREGRTRFVKEPRDVSLSQRKKMLRSEQSRKESQEMKKAFLEEDLRTQELSYAEQDETMFRTILKVWL